ncbi:MAG: hypothetical protein M0C28_46860 [Candidatus Moduliflexus flocculans]|nr:hypothetical protein [Candidatus Moduliflexus flocculans]
MANVAAFKKGGRPSEEHGLGHDNGSSFDSRHLGLQRRGRRFIRELHAWAYG